MGPLSFQLSRALGGLLAKRRLLCRSLTTSSSRHWKEEAAARRQGPGQGRSGRPARCLSSRQEGSPAPQSLQEEDHVLHGAGREPSAETEPKCQGLGFPLMNASKNPPAGKAVPGKPLQFGLERGGLASVTAVLRQTIPLKQAFYLERWKQRMILELGEDGFAEYTRSLFEQGKRFHAALERLLSPEETSLKAQEDDPRVSGYVASVQHVLQDVAGVRVLESAVRHQELQYQGIVDCVAEYRGTLCAIEWKTSEKPKPSLQSTFDGPLQLLAYVGALNHDENYDFQVACGLLVIAYRDGSPAHPHYVEPRLCSQYWARWLARLEEYKEKARRGAAARNAS